MAGAFNNRAHRSRSGDFLHNQLWEVGAFLAKAAFLFLLTPLMLRAWGTGGYGEWAVASSAMVFFSAGDLGVRLWLRVEASRAWAARDPVAFYAVWSRAVACGAVAAAVVVGACVLVALGNGWSRWFHLRPEHEWLLPLTAAGAMATMLSGLLTEPLSAQGRLGDCKLAAAAGWVLALPAVWAGLACGADVLSAVALWLGSLLAPNLALFFVSDLWKDTRALGRARPHWAAMRATFAAGSWFSATQIFWVLKTHGLTLVVAALAGPAAAGVFVVLLRLSEIIGTLGAASSDAAIAPLAQAGNAAHRAECFEQAYGYSLVFCAQGAVVVGLLAAEFLGVWLKPAPLLPPGTGLWVAAYGLAIAFNRVATGAAAGLGHPRLAALCGGAETLATLFGVWACSQWWTGPLLPLQVATLAALALLPVALGVCTALERGGLQTWLWPVRRVAGFAVGSAALIAAAQWTRVSGLLAAAIAAAGVLTLLNLRALRSPALRSAAATTAH